MNSILRFFLLLILIVSLGAKGVGAMAFELKSIDFANEGFIPNQFTCDGQDGNPQLEWAHPPEKVVSYALIVSDPDAPSGVWYHWLLYNIPSELHQLSANLHKLPEGVIGAHNSWGKSVYQGPCPPAGQHRYIFTLYALDQLLKLSSSASYKELKEAMKGHVLGEAKLIGVYQRAK